MVLLFNVMCECSTTGAVLKEMHHPARLSRSFISRVANRFVVNLPKRSSTHENTMCITVLTAPLIYTPPEAMRPSIFLFAVWLLVRISGAIPRPHHISISPPELVSRNAMMTHKDAEPPSAEPETPQLVSRRDICSTGTANA